MTTQGRTIKEYRNPSVLRMDAALRGWKITLTPSKLTATKSKVIVAWCHLNKPQEEKECLLRSMQKLVARAITEANKS